MKTARIVSFLFLFAFALAGTAQARPDDRAGARGPDVIERYVASHPAPDLVERYVAAHPSTRPDDRGGVLRTGATSAAPVVETAGGGDSVWIFGGLVGASVVFLAAWSLSSLARREHKRAVSA